MQFEDADIQSITENVWGAMLGLAVQSCAPPDVTADGLVGSIEIVGAWRGSMVMRCPLALARQAGAIMFGIDDGAAEPRHAEAAMSEITNMIGGNLKALLPEPCELRFPIVVPGADASVRTLGTPVAHVAFACAADVFSVTVHEREGAASQV